MGRLKMLVFTLIMTGVFFFGFENEASAKPKGFESYGPVYFDSNGDIYFSIQSGGLRMGIEKYDKKKGKINTVFDDKKKVYGTNGFFGLTINAGYVYFIYDKDLGSSAPGDYGLYKIKKNGKGFQLIKKDVTDYVIKGKNLYFVKRIKMGSGNYDFSYALFKSDLNGKNEKQLTDYTGFIQVLLYNGKPVFLLSYDADPKKVYYYDLNGRQVKITSKKKVAYQNFILGPNAGSSGEYVRFMKNVYGYDYFMKKTSSNKVYRRNRKTGKESVVTRFKDKLFMCDVYVKGDSLVLEGFGETMGEYGSKGFIKVVDLKKKKDIQVVEWWLGE